MTAGFAPPPYPYERLVELRAIAARHDGGVIDCSVGTPCDPPPAFVVEALSSSDSERGYPTSAGSSATREAAAGWLHRRFGVELDVDDIALCIGTKEFVASSAGFLHRRDPSRRVVLYPEVSYPTYAMSAALAGLESFAVPMHRGRLVLDAIPDHVADHAVLLWSNSPSNPTGLLDDLDAVARWGRAHHVPVFSDECYCEFTWDGSPRTILQGGVDGVVAVHSLSKRSNLAGIREGFYAGDPELVAYLRSVRQHGGLMVPGPVQAAASLAWADDEHVEIQRARYRERLVLMLDAFKHAGLDVAAPDGSFYLWVAAPSGNGWDLALELAERTGLLVSPGDFYGDASTGFVRIAVVQPSTRLAAAASRLMRH